MPQLAPLKIILPKHDYEEIVKKYVSSDPYLVLSISIQVENSNFRIKECHNITGFFQGSFILRNVFLFVFTAFETNRFNLNTWININFDFSVSGYPDRISPSQLDGVFGTKSLSIVELDPVSFFFYHWIATAPTQHGIHM